MVARRPYSHFNHQRSEQLRQLALPLAPGDCGKHVSHGLPVLDPRQADRQLPRRFHSEPGYTAVCGARGTPRELNSLRTSTPLLPFVNAGANSEVYSPIVVDTWDWIGLIVVAIVFAVVIHHMMTEGRRGLRWGAPPSRKK